MIVNLGIPNYEPGFVRFVMSRVWGFRGLGFRGSGVVKGNARGGLRVLAYQISSQGSRA